MTAAAGGAGSADSAGPTSHGTAATDGGGSDDGGPASVPELDGSFEVIATAQDGLSTPRDLEFAPDHPDQLWTANKDFHGMVIPVDPGTPQQRAETRVDYAQHFMPYVSSLAFGEGNRMATCAESRDEWNGAPQPPDDFMGPTLWSADLDIFAVVHRGRRDRRGQPPRHAAPEPAVHGHRARERQRLLGLRRLNGHLVRYDFKSDHGPGGGDHSDGSIRRFLNAVIDRVEGVPGHMQLDPDTRLLYVADPGSGNVMVLDVDSGASNGPLSGDWDGVGDYSGWDGASWTPVCSGLSAPSGLLLHDGRLFVGDHDTGEIIAFDLDGHELGRVATPAVGLMGLAMGPDGNLGTRTAAAATRSCASPGEAQPGAQHRQRRDALDEGARAAAAGLEIGHGPRDRAATASRRCLCRCDELGDGRDREAPTAARAEVEQRRGRACTRAPGPSSPRARSPRSLSASAMPRRSTVVTPAWACCEE
ncbi:MAG: hypothetical protein U0168_26045 [Nannocystaceae bacterium]